MTERGRKVIVWLPRILGIVFAVFLSMFALDAFGGDEPFFRQLLGFLIHLVPTAAVVAVVVLAWMWRHGGYVFIALGIVFAFAFDAWEHPASIILLVGIPVMLGVLFLLSHRISASQAAPGPEQGPDSTD